MQYAIHVSAEWFLFQSSDPLLYSMVHIYIQRLMFPFNKVYWVGQNFTEGPFLRIGLNCFKATEPLQGDGLLFVTQFSEFPGIHLIDLRRMKG